MDIWETVSSFATASAPALLVAAVWAFATGRVVPRWIFDESVRREQAWQTLYERERATAERLLEDRERRGSQAV